MRRWNMTSAQTSAHTSRNFMFPTRSLICILKDLKDYFIMKWGNTTSFKHNKNNKYCIISFHNEPENFLEVNHVIKGAQLRVEISNK